MQSSSKPTLLYIITKSDLGGAQGNVFDLIQGFRKDYRIHLAVGCPGALVNDVTQLGIQVQVLSKLVRSINLAGDILAILECISLIRKIKPSVIHAHSSKAGIVARIAGWCCNVPTVFTAHGWGFSPGTPRIRRLIAWIAERLVAQITTKIICVSESDRQLALKLGVGAPKDLVTIRCGIANQVQAISNSSKESVRVIMVARFNEQKDQATLLRSLALLSNSQLHVDFVGSGISMQVCQELAESLGVAHQVSFLGDRRDVSDLLARSQIFVLSTHYEGLPISILEAMRAGLPVVATSVNGIPEEVIDYKTGLLVSPQDPKALADAIQMLAESPELRLQMGRAGREFFEQEFTIERMLMETDRVYKQVIKKQHSKFNTKIPAKNARS